MDEVVPARHWHALPDGRLQCDLCPRHCRLSDGQSGLCFVRERRGEGLVLATYGRSSGFCVDPIEKKPLNHFLPGTAVLSFGTAGCNLTCKFCQNWDISKARDLHRLSAEARPRDIAATAVAQGCRSVAYTYNDPVIFLEYAVDVAAACRETGVRNAAVTAGYIDAEPRAEFFAAMDAANIDLKAFSEDFYRRLTGARLGPVLETLEYVAKETSVWLEITTLLIPGENDSPAEIDALTGWVRDRLGPGVPLHFSAFHPDWKMTGVSRTPHATLIAAHDIAKANGLRHVYVGNVRDPERSCTWCAGCGTMLIGRSDYAVSAWGLDGGGACRRCGTPLEGVFEPSPGTWGGRRRPAAVSSPA
jgi:pyruvate formate lyase activating enzyme